MIKKEEARRGCEGFQGSRVPGFKQRVLMWASRQVVVWNNSDDDDDR
jgi:hypothetical protein